MLILLLETETVEDELQEQHLALETYQQAAEDGDFIVVPGTQSAPLVGPGVWKLYPGALTEHGFCIRSREIAKQLLDSESFQQPFTPDKWEHIRDRLRSHARSVSIKTGFKRKQPGRNMTEIQKQLEQLRIENDEDRRQMPSLYAELRRYHSILVLDDSRRSGFSASKFTSQPNKPHPVRVKYIQILDCPEKGLVSNVRQKEETVVTFYTKLFSITTGFVADDADELLDVIPTDKLLSTEETATLLRPLSEEELGKALDQCAMNSAPGKDGLPFEFWKNLKEIVTPPFTEYCNRLADAEAPSEWPSLLGTLLFKKGDRKKLNNYRMLSVMNTDLR